MGQEGGSSDTVDKLTEVQKKVREIDRKGAPDKRGGGARVGVRQEREGLRVPRWVGGDRSLAGTVREQANGINLTNNLQRGKFKKQSFPNISTVGPARKSQVGCGEKVGGLSTKLGKSLVIANKTAVPSTSRSQGTGMEGGGQ